MKKNFVLLCFQIMLICNAIFCQEQSVSIVLTEQKKIKNNSRHMMGKLQKLKFKVENISDSPLIIYGENVDGEFDPEVEILRFNEKENSWLFSNGTEKQPDFNDYLPEEVEEFILYPKKTIRFERLFGYSCKTSKRKVAIYIKLTDSNNPMWVYSNEILLKDDSPDCQLSQSGK